MIHDLINDAAYMAHGYCLLWKPWLVALHAGSDLVTALAYFAIPVAIWIFLARRPDMELRGLATMFAAFILLCGMTHVFSLVTLWLPVYEEQGIVKAMTAAISLFTAITIFPLIPNALAIPSPTQLQIANKQLSLEVDAHRETLAKLEAARIELEQRVSDRTRELAEMTDRFRLLFERAPVAMFMVDGSGAIEQANAAAEGLTGYDKEELIGNQVEKLLPERSHALHLELRNGFLAAPAARPMGLGNELKAQRKNGTEISVEIGLNPIEVGGRVSVVASVIDTSERKQREEQIRLLMQEVNHRAKNVLGVVQAIARQTSQGDPAFVRLFTERLQALSASQDLLVESGWRGVVLADLVRSQLAHFGHLIGKRILLHGPDIRLTAAAAQTVGMALHELATNAAKYGALSTESGRVEVHWSRETGGDGKPCFVLRWQERQGPPVPAPTREGFGSTVTRRMVEIGLQAEVRLDYEPGGVEWEVRAPAEAVLESSGTS
jgi:PAS domain S-box-containing protein